MAKFEKKSNALGLRKQGFSLGSIANELNVSKSTASLWCRDVKLTSAQKQELSRKVFEAGKKGRFLGATKNHQKKIDAINFFLNRGRCDIGAISNRDLMLIGAALYWAEGRKAEGSFTLINSDPEMILLMYSWLVRIGRVKPEDLILHVSINEIHKPRIKKVLKYWANLLNLPLGQFRKPFYVRTPNKKIYENYDTYYGIMHLKVRCGTYLRYRVLGLIQAIKNAMPM